MGHAFGKLTWYRHVTTYGLSPLEQRIFPHLSKGDPNMLPLTQASILCASPPFVVFYLVYTWGTQEFKKSKRKIPAAYENGK
ncbi:cytochrome b-c1 complex subunit 8-like [Pteropus medius]|uniref:cytochrome b-c1 complex subunit 8-like n=1 Tax=Pteropus vampyrus TaxID=132908 RepID=UPI00196B932D|nr:cytochrome b-c1 complex subunit 8-like [Pteropus giganteus]